MPILETDYVAAGLVDRSGFEIDVDALLQLFLRQARAAGAQFVMNLGFDLRISRSTGGWRVSTSVDDFDAPVIVNAAGAWADQIATIAGVPPLGLTPLRRTALLVPPPEVAGFAEWPLVIDVDETFYFKPEGVALLISPADEEPSLPVDAAPDEMGVALAVDRFENAAMHPVRHTASLGRIANLCTRPRPCSRFCAGRPWVLLASGPRWIRH